MKKLAAMICIAGTAVTLSACDTTGSGNVETAAPYATERTASSEPEARIHQQPSAVKQERVFRQIQTK